MTPLDNSEGSSPPIIPLFYHTHAFPFLIHQYVDEINRRLIDVPRSLRDAHLADPFEKLGEASGDAPWQVLRNYLDKLEDEIAKIVRRHSPGFWFHLYRRLRPMLSDRHHGKTDDTTVVLVRRIAELAFAKHGDLGRTDDLGMNKSARLKTFLDGAWYEATWRALGSKLRARKQFEEMRQAPGVVMIDFHVCDLLDVFGVEGLCYEYWWASATMRSIGKGAIAKWDRGNSPPLRFKDTGVNPLCFKLYDLRNEASSGFHTRLGTWLDKGQVETEPNASKGDQIHFAQLTPNRAPDVYTVWNQKSQSMGDGFGCTNFGMGTFSLGGFRDENLFMADGFQKKHGISLNAVLFAIWAASFFGVYTGTTSQLRTMAAKKNRTMLNWTNLLFRGYTMVNFTLATLAKEAIWFAKVLKHDYVPDEKEALAAIQFISLDETSQNHISLWSGGKRPVLIPSMNGLMIELAAITPFLETLFFGVRKTPQLGGEAFEEAVRNALRSRHLEICLQGELRWAVGNPREVDIGVRIGDRLVLVECFSYEMPLDYERGKPSVFEKRREFMSEKLEQARSLAQRIKDEPKGTNFDMSWAAEVDWRVVSPFVEFAWDLSDSLFDGDGVPRLLQARELAEYLANGSAPAASLTPLLKQLRDHQFEGIWY